MYALAKKIQWSRPETHEEILFVVMFGGLHIKVVALKTIGDLLEGSGWTGALVRVGMATSGTADIFLKAYMLPVLDECIKLQPVVCICFFRGHTISMLKTE